MRENEHLLVGTRGWLHPDWTGRFYAEELPDDWRFCYYSNLVRSVLVPAELWDDVGPQEVAQWREDCDEGFRFVHELPAGLCRPAPGDVVAGKARTFLDALAPVGELTAGLLARPEGTGGGDLDWLAALADAFAGHYPLCVDLDMSQWPGEAAALLAERDVSLCWHPRRESQPDENGRFLVALLGQADLKQTRTVVERLGEWMSAQRGAALFFDDPQTSATQARDARILAELLGV
jgi:uncharacterized protein YecE (DUF72 family)